MVAEFINEKSGFDSNVGIVWRMSWESKADRLRKVK